MAMNAAWKSWISKHPYLEGIARFQAVVEAAAAAVPPTERRPAWDAWTAELEGGVPLLRSEAAALDVVREGAAALHAVAARVAREPLPSGIADGARALAAALADPDDAEAAIRGILPGGRLDPGFANPGLVRYLGWSALERVLAPVVAEAASRRDDERWRRGHCPTCGALPTMALLVERGDGRARLLACGLCKTRWKHKRVSCPFCENEDANRLGVLEIEGEPGLRLDVCEECKGYVKTYTGADTDPLVLADWPTLHLDVLAGDRGYERKGESIYELEG
jgi:FdhE protein